MPMSFENIDPQAAHARLEEGWIYLDVRTEEEFEEGHPPGAYNVPVVFRGMMGMEPNPEFVSVCQRHFPADAKLVVACKAGGRSLMACELLSSEGFQVLANMDGGFHGRPDGMGGIAVQGWAACGLPQAAKAEPGRTWDELSG